jgi:hypothetical protein
MADRAQVASVDAIEAFRSRLLVYLAKVRPVVEEAASDLRRTQLWIDTDQRLHWEREYRRRSRAHEEAQQALLSARISSFRGAIASEQMAVHRTREALAEADEKSRTLRRWSRDLGPLTQPLTGPVNHLDTLLAQDMSQAVAFLTEILRHLDAYSEARLDLPPPPTPCIPEATARHGLPALDPKDFIRSPRDTP